MLRLSKKVVLGFFGNFFPATHFRELFCHGVPEYLEGLLHQKAFLPGTGSSPCPRTHPGPVRSVPAAPVRVRRRLPEENPLESLPEVLVEDGVDDRVERRVAVAEPEGEGEAPALHATRRQRAVFADRADGADAVEEEEGEPAGDEAAHDEAEDEGRAPLFLPRYPLLLLLRIFLDRRLPAVGVGQQEWQRHLGLLRLLLALQLLQPGNVGGVAEVDLVSGLLAALPDSSPVVAFVVAVAAVAGVVAFGSVKELPLLAGVEQVVLFPGLLAPLLHLLDFALGPGKH